MDEEENFISLSVDPQFEKYMPFGRWKEFRRFFPEVFADVTKKRSRSMVSVFRGY